MTLQFVNKRFPKRPNFNIVREEKTEMVEEVVKAPKPEKNKSVKNSKKMKSVDKIEAAEMAIEAMEPKVKVVKKDRGLIERVESSKIILTEDNRQMLND